MKRLSSLSTAAALALAMTALCGSAAFAAEIAVLSAGAIEPGLKAAAAAFDKQTGHTTKITFNTAPELKKRMDSNPAFDVVIAPPAVVGEFAASGKLLDARANVGRVGMGVTVRDGAALPDMSSTDAMKRAVLAADSLVFNRASQACTLKAC